MKEITKEWFQRAEEDLKVGNFLFQEKKYASAACFHLHQAAEKFLKALLIEFGEEITGRLKIHNLITLYKYLKEKDLEGSESIREACLNLNKYYIATRYPGEATDYPWTEVQEALNSVKQIQRWTFAKTTD